MYQNFTTASSPETGAPRLAALRAVLKSAGLSGFLIPRADAHRGENVAACDERLAWLTGFTGSDGHCAVLPDCAAVFADGRYTLQLRNQIDTGVFTPQSIPDDKLADWLIAHLPEGTVGYDPMLHSFDDIHNLEKALAPHGVKLKPSANMVDEIWADRPKPPQGIITPYQLEFAGESSEDKRQKIAEKLAEAGLAAVVLTLPDSICWLLNMRGSDIAHTPVALCFAVLHADAGVDLVVDPAKVDATLLSHLGKDIRLSPLEDFGRLLGALSGTVGVDRATAPIWVSRQLASHEWFADPCILPKARKNEVELDGARQAHLRDAAAIAEFLAWVDAGLEGRSEIDVVQKLELCRRNTNALTDISFETICGTGANGAIVHYRVDETSNRTIEQNTLLLVDSGGQYLDGTTDITRTVIIGAADSEMIRCFTLVLKGMIALSMLRFPAGIAGSHIDTLARAPLWAEGLDYKHGTGHGVGAYLSVHEGPARISRAGLVPLETGMILSNEPGYYREGAWGIRIENLVVVEAPGKPEGFETPMHGFETLTWVPIDTRLIDAARLTQGEREWLNHYHQTVLEKVAPLVTPDTRIWLAAACAPI